MAPLDSAQPPTGGPPRPPVPTWRLLRERRLQLGRRLCRERAATARGGLLARALCPTANGFPVSTAGIFGQCWRGLVAVLDRQVVQLTTALPLGDQDNEAHATVDGIRWAARPFGGLGEHLSLQLHVWASQVQDWCERHQQPAALLRAGLTQLTDAEREAIATFVRQDLIPRLRAEADQEPATGEPARDTKVAAPALRRPADRSRPTLRRAAGPEPDPDEDESADIIVEEVGDGGPAVNTDWIGRAVAATLARWPRWCAYGGIHRHDLAPYWGPARPDRLTLTWGKTTYLALARLPAARAMAAQDRILEAAVSGVLCPQAREHDRMDTVYEDRVYSVLAAPSGHHYCCRRLGAYVLEDEHGTLYRFAPVRVGVRLDGLNSRHVLGPGTALLMDRCWHPFVFVDVPGVPICMPRPLEYYEELATVPLAEGILRHLESARMTLCSGVHAGNPMRGYFALGQTPGRVVITPRAAQEEGLPIYHYHRGER